MVDNHVRSLDPHHLVTKPLLTDSSHEDSYHLQHTRATEAAWNGTQYECYFCPRTFRRLQHLNQHLQSSVHLQKMYRCPKCQVNFRFFSALVQHVESEKCGVSRFRQTQSLMAGLSTSLNRGLLTF